MGGGQWPGQTGVHGGLAAGILLQMPRSAGLSHRWRCCQAQSARSLGGGRCTAAAGGDPGLAAGAGPPGQARNRVLRTRWRQPWVPHPDRSAPYRRIAWTGGELGRVGLGLRPGGRWASLLCWVLGWLAFGGFVAKRPAGLVGRGRRGALPAAAHVPRFRRCAHEPPPLLPVNRQHATPLQDQWPPRGKQARRRRRRRRRRPKRRAKSEERRAKIEDRRSKIEEKANG